MWSLLPWLLFSSTLQKALKQAESVPAHSIPAPNSLALWSTRLGHSGGMGWGMVCEVPLWEVPKGTNPG